MQIYGFTSIGHKQSCLITQASETTNKQLLVNVLTMMDRYCLSQALMMPLKLPLFDLSLLSQYLETLDDTFSTDFFLTWHLSIGHLLK